MRGQWVQTLCGHSAGQSLAQRGLCVLRSREALGALGIPRDQSLGLEKTSEIIQAGL